MRSLVIVFVSVMILFTPVGYSSASEHGDQEKWVELNQTSDRILQLVREGKYSDAKQLLDYFSTLFLDIGYDEKRITMAQLRVVTTSYERAMGAVTSASQSHEERLNDVLQFRLVVDALVSEHHPLWKNTEKNVLAAFSSMKEAAKESNGQAFQQHLNEFLNRYHLIRPAIMITIAPQYYERIESQIRFVERNRANFVSQPENIQHLNRMEKDLHSLYKGFKEDSADPSLWWVIMSVGGMIVVSLTYVGYKKYRAEKNKVKVKE